MRVFVITTGLILALWPVSAPAQAGNLVQNGSFENVGAGFSLSSWSERSIDVVDDEALRAADGSVFVVVHGSLYQDIPTVPGEQYVLRFAFGGSEQVWATNTPMILLWGGQQVASIPATLASMTPQWRYLEYQAAAQSSTTRLTFSSPDGDAFAFVDDVSVRAAGWAVGWGGNDFGQITPCADGIVGIAAGYEQSLLLKRDGTVCACGMFYAVNPQLGVPIVVPEDLSNVVQVAAGRSHCVALKSNGTVVAWGSDDSYGQLDVPADLSNVVEIASGDTYNLALKADGTVVAWGAAAAAVPPGLKNIVAVAVGGGGLCEVANGPAGLALRADGTLFGWGWAYGLDTNHVVEGVSNVVAISAGYDEWLALEADGTVEQVQSTNACYWSPPGLSNIVAISASPGNDHHISLALKADGTVVGWGFNFYGGLDVPPGLSNVVAVAAGGGHCLALVGGGPPLLAKHLVNRNAVLTGKSYFLAEATGAWPLSYQWRHDGTNLPGQTNIVLALTDLQLSQAGDYSVTVTNAYGVVTSEDAVLSLIPLQINTQPQNQTNVAGSTVVLRVIAQGGQPLAYQWRRDGVDLQGATGSTLSLANVQLDQSGDYSVEVSNGLNTLTSSVAKLTVLPVLITTQPQDRVAFWGGDATFSVSAKGQQPMAYQWRFNGAGLPGATTPALTLADLGWDQAGLYSVNITNAIGGTTSTEASLSVVAVAAWGAAIWGGGDLGQATVPPILTNASAIAAGMVHSLALADGRVVAWGQNGFGQTNVPGGLSDMAGIAGGSCALPGLAFDQEGKVVNWGGNTWPPPCPPAGLSNVVAAAVGKVHLLALKSDGTVVAWGDDSHGEATVPSGLSNVVAISAGALHSLALKADGTVVAWGAGTFIASPPDIWDWGQSIVPDGLSNVVAVAAGERHSLALKADGTIVGWGDDSVGQLDVPPEATDVVAIAAGEFHNLALRGDGTVVAWGEDSNGQTDVPPDLSNVRAIAAGGSHSLALVGNGPPVQHVSLTNLHLDTSGFCVSLPTERGRVYRLEYKHALSDRNWIPLPLVAGTGSMRTLTDPTPLTAARFYRVRRW